MFVFRYAQRAPAEGFYVCATNRAMHRCAAVFLSIAVQCADPAGATVAQRPERSVRQRLGGFRGSAASVRWLRAASHVEFVPLIDDTRVTWKAITASYRF